MAFSEIDSFVEKFKHLWHAGIKASLNVESFDGEACVTLQAGLGNIPPPYQFPSYPPRPPRGPAYERRQEKRKAARQAPAAVRESLPEASGPQSENIKSTVEADGASKISDNTTADQAARSTAVMNENDAVKADDNFYCQLCDFKSKWENGLNIHMKRKHSIIEQIDGNVSVSEDATNHDDKYSNTRHYWEKGHLGTMYQTFLDANEIIDNSDLSEEDKVIEKARVLEARKKAFGFSFENFPPWSTR